MLLPCLGCQYWRCTVVPNLHESDYVIASHSWCSEWWALSDRYWCLRVRKWKDNPRRENEWYGAIIKRFFVSYHHHFRFLRGIALLTICFSEYLFDESKLTASIWPKSMSWPSRKMNNSLHTYFFFWYPSSVLSPLNLLRMLANSLFIRFTSDSLLLPSYDIYVCEKKRGR